MLGGPMEVGTFLRIAIAIASALGRVHQHRLVHKDIKPPNILVNSDSGEVRWPLPGDELLGYEIVEPLGRGGLARVFLARHATLTLPLRFSARQ